MNCSTFRRHLNETEHGRGVFVLPPALQLHLDECELCQRAWQTHNLIVRELESDARPLLSPQFTAQVMAKLPALSPFKPQKNLEAIFLAIALAAGLLATWFVSEGLRQSLFAFVTNGILLDAGERMLDALLWSWQEVFVNTLGVQVLKQGLQILLITLVTIVVAKGAVALEHRLRRMLKTF